VFDPNLGLTENAITTLEKRYLRKDPDGNIIETPAQMFERVANHVASAETTEEEALKWGSQFYEAMAAREFIPNSPTLMNAGLNRKGTLSACFVIPVPDSLEGIMTAAYAGAMVQKYGGGTGYSGSRIRAMGSQIASTHGVACGAIKVLKQLNEVSVLVTQGGTREGANMGVLRIDHPEIEQFIALKAGRLVDAQRNTYEVTNMLNFNISVGATDAFMEDASDPTDDQPVELVDPHYGPTGVRLSASGLFSDICTGAWRSGDPGLLFLDKINSWRSNPVPSLGPIETTNPCGEKPMYPWDSCVLAHVNLEKIWISNNDGSIQTSINWAKLAQSVRLGVRFLDNVISVNDYPEIPGYDVSPIKEMSENLRRIGLGVLGFGNLLFRLRIPYNSQQALDLATDIMKFINQTAWEASRDLAKERGPFPLFEESIYTMHAHPAVPEEWRGIPIRNAVRTTIAPTGTTSFILDASPGIEPLFGLAFYRQHRLTRNEKSGENESLLMEEFNPVLHEVLEDPKLGLSENRLAEIRTSLLAGITLRQAASELPSTILDTFITSSEISAADHVAMQAAWQVHVDDAVSKTINLPNDATVEVVKHAYMDAYERGCLGITVFRDGSRSEQVYSTSAGLDADKRITTNIDPANVGLAVPLNNGSRERLPQEAGARRHKFRVGTQEGFLHVGLYDDGRPGEIFITLSKQGSTLAGFADAVAILTSRLLQFGDTVDDLARQFEGTRFDPAGLTNDDSDALKTATSIVDYIFRKLREEYGTPVEKVVQLRIGTSVEDAQPLAIGAGSHLPLQGGARTGQLCPDCSQEVYYAEGCAMCNCGWSNCG
jgi:ribonucleoside-diphosphate reductase alpha chain